MLLVCAGAQAGEFAERYGARLAELDKARPESVCEARDQLRAWLPKAGSADRATMFRAFLKFNRDSAVENYVGFSNALSPVRDRMDQILERQGWRANTSASPLLRGDAEVHRSIGVWLDCGFGIYQSEGNFNLGPDVATLREFAAQVGGDLGAWIHFLEHEGGFADPVEEDFGLRITWQELGNRLHRWETFLRGHPSLNPEAGHEVRRLAWMFFFGMDNATIFGDDGRMDSAVLAAWRRFTRNPAPSRYTATMLRLLKVLDANDHALTPEALAMKEWIAQELDPNR